MNSPEEKAKPMSTLSKEVIFNKHSFAELGAISPSKSFCLAAMEEYAKQEAFQFAKFLDDNHFRRNRASNLWFDNNFRFLKETELYDLYTKQKQG